MVIQTRQPGPDGGVLRCFRQHDHALLSGELASVWVGASGHDAPAFRAVLAIGMHDIGWQDVDAAPRLDPARGRPFDFVTLPVDDRVALYDRGIDALERLHPYAGLLGSLHFSAFIDPTAAPAFARRETTRRARLTTALAADPEQVQRDVELLRALDLLSLIACLAQPGRDKAAVPKWLGDTFQVAGVRYRADWVSEWGITLEPFPLRDTLVVRMDYREIPVAACRSQATLDAAWAGVESRTGSLVVGPPPLAALPAHRR